MQILKLQKAVPTTPEDRSVVHLYGAVVVAAVVGISTMEISDLILSLNISILDMALRAAAIEVQLRSLIMHRLRKASGMVLHCRVMAITTVLHYPRMDSMEARRRPLRISITNAVPHHLRMDITGVHHRRGTATTRRVRLQVVIRVLALVHIGSVTIEIKGGKYRYSGLYVGIVIGAISFSFEEES